MAFIPKNPAQCVLVEPIESSMSIVPSSLGSIPETTAILSVLKSFTSSASPLVLSYYLILRASFAIVDRAIEVEGVFHALVEIG